MPDALPPVDTTVALPPSVQRAAEAADALHARVYAPPAPEPPAPPDPKPIAGITDPELQPQPPAPPTPPAPVAPEPHDPAVTPTRDDLRDSEWARRYNSMKGRYDVSQQTMGSMQEQLSELGDELMRTQQALQLARRGNAPEPPTPHSQPPRRQVNEEDVKTYGPELIEFVTRAARDAIAPELEQVNIQVRQTNQKVTKASQGALYAALDEEVPTWKQINVDPRFKNWCRLPDVYSGQLRGKLLNAAFQAADAPRVVAFFQGFLSEEQATGQMPAPQPEPPPAPRQAAIPLDTLAAPGRAKPAGGDGPAGAADKPVFTRAQISSFYSDVRKGVYNGRDADKLLTEQQIFAAQREGRVR